MIEEHPIIFSGEMVRAILDGRKTMTRRTRGLEKINERPDDWTQAVQLNDGTWSFWHPGNVDEDWVRNKAYPDGRGFKCPYGVPGDRLWVKETWVARKEFDHLKPREIPTHLSVDYPATDIPFELGKTRPSIFMPRWASRITLEILNVKAERLQEISNKDAITEGCIGMPCNHNFTGPHGCTDCNNSGWIEPPKLDFMTLWDSLNGKKYPWASNPWVWVIEFSRCQP